MAINFFFSLTRKVQLDQCLCFFFVCMLCILKPPISPGRWPITLSQVLIVLKVTF